MLVLILVVARKSQVFPENPGQANFALANSFSDRAVHEALYGRFAENIDFDQSGGGWVHFRSVLVEPRWIEGSSAFWYTTMQNGSYSYNVVDSENGSKETLFDLDELSAAIRRETGHSINLSSRIPNSLRVTNEGRYVELNVGPLRVQYERSTKILTYVERSTENVSPAVSMTREISVSPDGQNTVFSFENNLFLLDHDGTQHQLTFDGEKWYGFSRQIGSVDSQKPLQRRMGWLGNSSKFFVEIWDNREVSDSWFIDSVSAPRPTLRTTKFPMPGEQNVPIQELWIFDASTREGYRVNADKWPGQFIGDMDIGNRAYQSSSDGKYLYFTRMSRGFHNIELLRVDSDSGDLQVLVSEESEPYFTIRYPTFALVNDGKEVVWASDRSGENNYYLYGGGGLKSSIASGSYTARRIAHLDEASRTMVFEAFGKEPTAYPFHRMYYKASLDGGSPRLLTPEDATHEAFFSPDGQYFVDNFSRADAVPTAVLRDGNGELVMRLEETDASKLLSLGFRLPEYFTAKAADSETDLFGVMWKPADFDSSKTYPVVAAVQPNPSMSGASFGKFRPGNVASQLAQLGMVVVEFRTRGQGRHVRNKEYVLHSYGNERDYPLADAKKIIEQLAERHDYLDPDRVGVYGHSGGGFMAAALCMTYPTLFKVCISSSGNHDNRIAEQNSSEYHWGIRQAPVKNPAEGDGEIEWITNMHPNQELAPKLDSHLLIMHGDNDTDTHFSHSVRLADSLIKANKRFDFMIFPSKDHGYGEYNDYFDRLRWAYFAEHLLGDRRRLIDLSDPVEPES